MIKEARVFDVKHRQDLGLRVLTMRQWPRGIARTSVDVWLPDAGPSAVLLADHREGLVSWTEFEHRYREEQQVQETCRVVRYASQDKVSDVVVGKSPVCVLQELEGKHGTVTVLCWERGCECHRFALVELASECINGSALV